MRVNVMEWMSRVPLEMIRTASPLDTVETGFVTPPLLDRSDCSNPPPPTLHFFPSLNSVDNVSAVCVPALIERVNASLPRPVQCVCVVWIVMHGRSSHPQLCTSEDVAGSVDAPITYVESPRLEGWKERWRSVKRKCSVEEFTHP